MPVSSDTRTAILTELIHMFEEQFGQNWMSCLDKNLRGNPYKDMAVRHGVSENYVRSLRSKLMGVGAFLRCAQQAAALESADQIV